jgi:hypothetical protein
MYQPPQGDNQPTYQTPQYTQYPPQFAPPPPPRKRRTWLWVLLGALALLVLGCVGIVAIASTATQTGTQPQATSTTAVNTPAPTTALSTPTTNPTPTSKPQPAVGPAVLGAPLDAFIAKLGPPNDHSSTSMPHFKRRGNSNVDQVILLQGEDNQRVSGVTISACTSSDWTMSAASAACAPYLPSDAVFKRSVYVTASPALDKIYYSSSIAHEFDPGDFTDANGNTVKPGLFDVNYLYVSSSDTTHIDDCDILLGTQQTQ